MTRKILVGAVLAATALTLPAAALETSPCPRGDKGVVVSHGGHALTVCTNAV
jgi:hypothetical protein